MSAMRGLAFKWDLFRSGYHARYPLRKASVAEPSGLDPRGALSNIRDNGLEASGVSRHRERRRLAMSRHALRRHSRSRPSGLDSNGAEVDSRRDRDRGGEAR